MDDSKCEQNCEFNFLDSLFIYKIENDMVYQLQNLQKPVYSAINPEACFVVRNSKISLG